MGGRHAPFRDACLASAAIICVAAILCVLVFFWKGPVNKRETFEVESSEVVACNGEDAPPSRPLIIVSLTTTPTRLPHIDATLRSLFDNQTLQPDAIELNLPNLFRRDNTPVAYSDIVRFSSLPHLRIHRVNDVGPITKFAPTLLRYASKPDTMIVVVDDDTLYPSNLIERLVAAAASHPEAIVTAHCTDMYTHNGTACDMVEGFKSYLLRPGLFRPAFWAYLRIALASSDCYRSDDFVLSSYMHMAKIPVLRIYDSSVDHTPQLHYGFQTDALHKLGSPNTNTSFRYCECYLHLKENLPGPVALHAKCPDEPQAPDGLHLI